VRRRLILTLGFVLLSAFVLAGPALAAPQAQPPAPATTDWTILVVGLTFLLPIGLILLSVAALAEEQAVSAATGGLVAWGLAILAYFAVGFAFQFGGIAVVHDTPDLTGLYWEYSLLDTTWGTGWGMIGLKGFLMLGDASTSGALGLFLSQLPLLGVATLILYFALQGRTRRWVILLASLLMGSLVYPLIGNWTWGGGWLANLGRNLAQGHGLVDAGGSGQVALAGAAAALAALLVFRSRPVASPVDEVQTSAADLEAADPDDDEEALPDEPESVPMPPVHLPLLGLLGVVLMMIGWMGMAFMAHLPTAVGVLPAPMAVNLVLGALGGALTAALYSWFTTGNLNSLMSARGMAAGLVVVAAGAPFIPAWSALVAGLVVGFLLPPLIYFFNRVLHLDDSGGALATFALPAIFGLLLPALVADGRYGAGWNGTGLENFLGVAGQGVSGLLVAPGFAANWPAQIYAQLVGAIAIFVWSLGLSWLLMRSLAGLIHAWERTGLEFGTPPEPVVADEEAPPMQGDTLEAGEEGVSGLVGGQEIRT
jgi:Amt family ammonium transporter